jgi:hypothetical protein
MLVIFSIILIVMLTVTAVSLKKPAPLPEEAPSKCPDFWLSSYYKPCVLTDKGCCPDGVTAANADQSNCTATSAAPYGYCSDGVTAKTSETDVCQTTVGPPMCWNVHNLGANVGKCTKIDDFSEFDAKNGESTLCRQQKWANTCKLTWAGVTNLPYDCT